MIAGLNKFTEYEDAIVETAIYPECHTGSKAALTYCALGLMGESGEVAEKIKKYIRDGVIDRDAIAKELGDVVWYVTRLANEMGYSLETVANKNIIKLRDRKQRGVIQGSGDDR